MGKSTETEGTADDPTQPHHMSVYRSIRSAHIQPHATNLIGQTSQGRLITTINKLIQQLQTFEGKETYFTSIVTKIPTFFKILQNKQWN